MTKDEELDRSSTFWQSVLLMFLYHILVNDGKQENILPFVLPLPDTKVKSSSIRVAADILGLK